ncbi:MAG: protoheme IX farnesyltransferase [Anaerolineales bacterium]|nr:protoheme IX farnesyltransferase [Anaerolineales bacterium]
MKFSLSSSFARLTLFVLVAVFLVTIGGRLVTLSDATEACMGWPLCQPQGILGWMQLFHRASVGFASALMLYLLYRAWRDVRDHRVLLPLTTLTVVLFFAQAFVGAMEVTRGFPLSLMVLHDLTAVALWAGLLGLVLASGFLARETVAFPPLDFKQRMGDFLTLTKPIVVLLLLVTTYAGMVVGGQAWPSLSLTFWTLLGGFMAAGGSSALNQYIDRDLDKHMQRTSRRPLAAGRMTPAEGLAFGLALSVLSFYIYAGFVNLLAAFLSLAGIIYYVVLYSILLKKATVQNIVIGGGAGAIPPLVGWAAATGGVNIPALFLFAIVFMWTPPHFWALAIVRKNDYARAGVPMMPVVRGEKETRWQILIYTLELVAVTLLMPVFKFTGTIYLVSAVALGLWLIHTAWQVWRVEGNKIAWKMYRYSSMYLAFIFLALMLDAVM